MKIFSAFSKETHDMLPLCFFVYLKMGDFKSNILYDNSFIPGRAIAFNAFRNLHTHHFKASWLKHHQYPFRKM